MKNRLLAYGFGSEEPETAKATKTPAKKPRARWGKRTSIPVARFIVYFSTPRDGTRETNGTHFLTTEELSG